MNLSEDFLFQHSKLGIAYVAMDGSCLKANETLCNMLGICQEDILHCYLHDLIHPDDQQESMEELEQLIKGETAHITSKKRYIDNRGTPIRVSSTVSIVRSEANEPQYLILQIQNITDHKRAEVDLFEAETFCDNLVNQALVGVYLFQDENTIYINPYLARIFGYTQEEFLQRKANELIVEEDYIELVKRGTETLANNNATLEFTVRGLKKNQNILYLEGSCLFAMYKGKPAVLGTAQDVTYKKQTEELLLESTKKYQRLLRYLPEPIIVHKEGTILYANRAAFELVKAESNDELIGKSVFDFLHPDYHKEVQEIIFQVLKTDEASDFRPRNIYCVKKELIEVEVSSIRIDDAEDNTVILSVLRDIRDRKQAEEMLIQSEKLSVIGQLAAGIAHEIRNPLTSLKGFTQILKSKSTDQEALYFDIMQQELDRINLIVNDFMTLAKPNENQFSAGSIIDIFQSVISILETQAIMTNVNIKQDYMDELASIYCDANQLKQVFLNIIKNAIEAMPDGGEVTITIKEEKSKSKSRRLHIQIKDQGIGIPQTIIEKIGQPFFTTKENGTGLGLMISQRIIGDHNGTFQISSNERGTIVNVHLPILENVKQFGNDD
jgi:PAS domain S-box-containing protein